LLLARPSTSGSKSSDLFWNEKKNEINFHSQKISAGHEFYFNFQLPFRP
jgi:hypothetical protein